MLFDPIYGIASDKEPSFVKFTEYKAHSEDVAANSVSGIEEKRSEYPVLHSLPAEEKQEPPKWDGQTRRVTMCEHVNAKYYSKGYCYNCYHRRGREKKATGCPHPHRMLYARKLCKGCYLKYQANKKK